MSGTAISSSPLQQPAARYAAFGATKGALDIALAWDPSRQGCDLVWQNGDFALDTTPTTNMLMALGCDRRARPDDTLPDDGSAWTQPSPGGAAPLIDLRRGWCGDALDAQGRRTGSRLWLLERAKQTEQTRKLAEGAAAEALAQVKAMLGVSIQLTVRWVRAGVLGIRAAAGAASADITQRVRG
jgi:phage gp46-like protein